MALSTPVSKKVEYEVRGQVMEGVAVFPAGEQGPAGCVLVGHDWSGINRHTLATCEAIAGLGFVGFAVDVYGKGLRGDPYGDNARLMAPCLEDRGLLMERMVGGLQAAAGLPQVDSTRLAALGYCFGGLCCLDLARCNPAGLVGVVAVHGLLTPPPGVEPIPIGARLLLLHGWSDPMVPPEDVVAAAAAFTAAGATWELHAYGHALHAFTFEGADFPERGIQHQPLAHRRSWAATQQFLQEVLLAS